MRLPINHNGHIATCVANAHAHSLRHTHTHTKSHIQTNTRAHPHTLLQTLHENCCIPCGVVGFTVHVFLSPFSTPLLPLLSPHLLGIALSLCVALCRIIIDAC